MNMRIHAYKASKLNMQLAQFRYSISHLYINFFVFFWLFAALCSDIYHKSEISIFTIEWFLQLICPLDLPECKFLSHSLFLLFFSSPFPPCSCAHNPLFSCRQPCSFASCCGSAVNLVAALNFVTIKAMQRNRIENVVREPPASLFSFMCIFWLFTNWLVKWANRFFLSTYLHLARGNEAMQHLSNLMNGKKCYK